MTKIKIGAKLYSILHTNQTINEIFKEEPNANGYISYPTSEIHIRNTNSSDTIEETTIHEILHALIDNAGVPDQNLDTFINVLTPRLHAFLKDNPDFFITLLNK